MKLEKIPTEFLKASAVIEAIQEHSFEAYFVGGSVRDALLNQKIHDVDIATSAYPEEIKQIFQRTIDVGIEHGTVLVLVENEQYEITSFRTESTYQDFRRPDKVFFVRSLAEDLKRRDFTINSLAMQIDGQIVDLFEGIADIDKKLIRAVGDPKERFYEDALRIMRGLRFASQLDFSIEPETFQAMKEHHLLLEKISVERISIEFTKLLLGQNRQEALLSFIETECYCCCPQLKHYSKELKNFSQLPKKRIEKSAQAWALLVYHLGLVDEEIRSFLKDWKLSNHLIGEIYQIILGLRQRLKGKWQAIDVFRLGLESCLAVEELLVYFHQESNCQKVREQYQVLPIHDRKELAITGNDLLQVFCRQPGQWLGHLIDTLEVSVVERKIKNERQSLIVFAQIVLDEE